jgi:hypothetical protein
MSLFEGATVKNRLLTGILLSFAIAASACAVRRSHDYIFGVTGVVTNEDETPIRDADVTLELNGPVYSGISPVTTERLQTNNTGGFVFMHSSHERGVKYTLTVHKVGFESQTVSGSAPPDGHHTIRLKKASSL